MSICCCYKKPSEVTRTRLDSMTRGRLDSMARTRLDSMARTRLDSMASVSRPRTWSDALLARIYSHRYSTPPAYEPPPPYHVALQMETEAQKPPKYFHVKVETVDEENPPEYSAMSSEKQTSPLETLV